MKTISTIIVAVALLFGGNTARAEDPEATLSVDEGLAQVVLLSGQLGDCTIEFSESFDPSADCRTIAYDDSTQVCTVGSDCPDTDQTPCLTVTLAGLRGACTIDRRQVVAVQTCRPCEGSICMFQKHVGDVCVLDSE